MRVLQMGAKWLLLFIVCGIAAWYVWRGFIGSEPETKSAGALPIVESPIAAQSTSEGETQSEPKAAEAHDRLETQTPPSFAAPAANGVTPMRQPRTILKPGRLAAGRFRELPDASLARREVSADVHSTPASLRAFAMEVADALDSLDPNSHDARLFTEDLALCVRETRAARSARAYCLSLLRDLGHRTPSLLSREAARAAENAAREAPEVDADLFRH